MTKKLKSWFSDYLGKLKGTTIYLYFMQQNTNKIMVFLRGINIKTMFVVCMIINYCMVNVKYEIFKYHLFSTDIKENLILQT